jgi:tRNA(Ile)-lysidine synthase
MLLRPLLSVRRADLRSFLSARGDTWLDDPANDDQQYARVRARRALTGTDPTERAVADLDPALPTLARQFRVEAAFARAPLDPLLRAPSCVSKPVLAAALLSLSGGVRPPRGPELDRLLVALAERRTVTLCGCRISTRSGEASIARAPPRRGEPIRPLEPEELTWSRFAAACGLYSDEATLPRR